MHLLHRGNAPRETYKVVIWEEAYFASESPTNTASAISTFTVLQSYRNWGNMVPDCRKLREVQSNYLRVLALCQRKARPLCKLCQRICTNMLLDISSFEPSARGEVFNRCISSPTTPTGDYIGSLKVKEQVEQGFSDSKIAFRRSTGVIFGLYDNERIKIAAHGDNNRLIQYAAKKPRRQCMLVLLSWRAMSFS